MKSILEDARSMQAKLTATRRELHKHPELSYQEYWTSKYIAERLQSLDIEVIPWGGETGVIGLLRGQSTKEVVGLRADIDALPVQELNQVEYRSQTEGQMHACGHDSHITSVLGAAELLAMRRKELKGSVKFIFQPAEEIVDGAKKMMEHKVLENPQVTMLFGLHNNPEMQAGQVALKDGALMAAVDTTFLTVTGRPGHGGVPHTARDSIIATAAMLMSLQTIVSRRVDPLESAVISFGSIHGGKANNAIPEKVELTGTVRTFNPQLRAELPALMENVIKHTAAAYDVNAEFVYRKDLPAVINPPHLIDWARGSLSKIIPSEDLIRPAPNMGGEDYAIFQESVPGIFLWLGVGNKAKGIGSPWHSSIFDIDETALPFGAASLAQLTYDWLQK